MEGVSPQSSLIGATIGNYRVVAKLGEGGMGSVYLAEHPLIGKKVALKVLHEEYSANQDVVARFFNEAKAVNDIGHPNIVDIIDYGVVATQTGPGFVYFIMEFLAGESLSSLIQRESPIPPERAFHIAMQVADALASSHQKGVIHRDLKPDNIYLIQRGREKDFVKVLDFGIAKLTGDAPGSRRTRTGIVMGTPAYMSPEQCEGKGNIDARTDVYALGIVLYEMITGRVPFAGEGYGEVLVQHLTKKPERPTTARGAVPPIVEAVIMKSLEKKREDRFQTMDDFIVALRDPQAYIDARGGIDTFYQPDAGGLAGTGGVMAPGQARTPYPAATPGMGLIAPGMATPGTGVHAPTRPGTPGAMAMADEVPAGRSKTPLIVAGAVVALAAIGGVVALVMHKSGGGKSTASAAQPPPVAPFVEKPADTPPSTTPPPVEPVAKTVAIKITSDPDGADVYVGDEKTPRGKTPIQLELARSDGETMLTVKAAGYKDKQRSVKLSRDAELEIALEQDKTASAQTGHGSSGRSHDHGSGGRTGQTGQSSTDKTGDKGTQPGADDVLAPKF
jgi:serine/threonine-protein kinase